jgi:two-component system, LytTR family, sensor kinase
LKALRAQIDPHFLFNALNAIAGLLHHDPATADLTIERLAEVFRYTLRRSHSEWAILEDEIDFVHAYLDVERARFGDRLAVRIDVTPEARRARVPTMVLQTLVENAIKHGVSEVPGPARLDVDVRDRNGRLEMTVSDNGPRFDAGSAAGAGGGYGLANIRQRLAGYYGEAAALHFSRDEAQGRTSVTVSLPMPAIETTGAPGDRR